MKTCKIRSHKFKHRLSPPIIRSLPNFLGHMRKKNYKHPPPRSGGWREGKDRVWGKKDEERKQWI